MSFSLLSISEFIGRFHPVVVHLPIGILLLALLLQFLSRKEQYTLSFAVMKVIWLLGVLTAVLACITGYLLSASGDYEGGTVALHMWLGIGVAFVSLLVCAKVFSRQFDTLYKIASIALLILIIAAGHFGGSLTHGADFLTSALYKPVGAGTATLKPIPNVQEAQVYADVVQPVLQTKCYSCHGPQKQKGKLRLDDSTYIMKGGKNGPALEAGKAEESELIKRLLLPKEDEHHMPPKEKPQLTKQQISLLHWWVEQGAPFRGKVKELPQPEEIKPALAALQQAEKKQTLIIPEAPVAKADEKAIEALKARGVVVMPVAQNSNYLMASFVTAADFSDQDAALLLPLKQQLAWLKMGDTKIGDAALSVIAQCSNLTLLHLNGTQVTDKGLASLKSLSRLQSLNLVGTKVSLEGVKQLQPLKQLQSLYLYQTRVRPADWAQLKKIFPKTTLDSGGYTLPLLASDTTLVQQAALKN